MVQQDLWQYVCRRGGYLHGLNRGCNWNGEARKKLFDVDDFFDCRGKSKYSATGVDEEHFWLEPGSVGQCVTIGANDIAASRATAIRVVDPICVDKDFQMPWFTRFLAGNT